MAIGKRIKEARLKKSMTQEELAKKVGVTKGAIANYESNTSHPKEPVMYALIDALGVDANFLFQDFLNLPDENAPPYSDEAMRLADDYDKRLDHYGRKQVRSVADNEIARVEAANTKMEAGEIDVDTELAEYSRQLNLQKKAGAGSSASSGSEGKGA